MQLHCTCCSTHPTGTALVNGAFKDISKADYAGKWVVLFFYPMDFTFVVRVCPPRSSPSAQLTAG